MKTARQRESSSSNVYSDWHRLLPCHLTMVDIDLILHSTEDSCLGHEHNAVRAIIECKHALQSRGKKYSVEDWKMYKQHKINEKCAESIGVPYYLIVKEGEFAGTHPMNYDAEAVNLDDIYHYPTGDTEGIFYVEYRSPNSRSSNYKIVAIILTGDLNYHFSESELHAGAKLALSLGVDFHSVRFYIPEDKNNTPWTHDPDKNKLHLARFEVDGYRKLNEKEMRAFIASLGE